LVTIVTINTSVHMENSFIIKVVVFINVERLHNSLRCFCIRANARPSRRYQRKVRNI
ncbi:hypothetical protein L9F63_006115, partial [Diploptera punctata]